MTTPDHMTRQENLHRRPRLGQEEFRRWNAQTEATWVKEASKLLKRDFQGLRMELEADPDGELLTFDEWKQLCRNGPARRRHGA